MLLVQIRRRLQRIETMRWLSGRGAVRTYRLDELLATKLRALYQRRRERDLFDLWEARTRGRVEPGPSD